MSTVSRQTNPSQVVLIEDKNLPNSERTEFHMRKIIKGTRK